MMTTTPENENPEQKMMDVIENCVLDKQEIDNKIYDQTPKSETEINEMN